MMALNEGWVVPTTLDNVNGQSNIRARRAKTDEAAAYIWLQISKRH
jgi:hypothetical protein